MSKKRGLSLEEKREKMLQIFYETQDFFLLKDLEKKGPSKGVISQSVKDVIQSLVDDDLVCRDKIGTSIYFWALPSQAGNQLRQAKQKYTDEIAATHSRIEELESMIQKMKSERQDADREEKLKVLRSLEEINRNLKSEVEKYIENDPEVLEQKKKAAEVALTSANRWTDNVFSLQQWCSKNFPNAKDNLMNLYTEAGITDDFDYIEE